MTPLLRSVVLTCCLLILILAGCASDGIPKWRHFHGNLAGQGYIPVESGFALSSHWISKPYRITTSSPVIGSDFQDREIIYIGSSDGVLLSPRLRFAGEELGVESEFSHPVIDVLVVVTGLWL